MLGWEVMVFRAPARREDLVCSWIIGPSGLRWIDELVKHGRAVGHGGNGYPLRYEAQAGIFLPILRAGVPTSKHPVIIGDDYALPENWGGTGIKWNRELAEACQPEEVLFIEAWDQS